jgi:hypothetical protein
VFHERLEGYTLFLLVISIGAAAADATFASSWARVLKFGWAAAAWA